MTPYLAPDELHELTGRQQRSKQIEWLRANRWRFTVRADGQVRVARDYWRHRMVGDVPAPAANDAEPNFAAVAKGA